MGMSWRKWAAVVGSVGAFAVAGAVWAMTVQPVAVDLTMVGRGMSAPVRVENNGPNPLPVEIRLVETDFRPEGVGASNRPTEDVIAFPPQAIIPPGGTQVFRLQYVGELTDVSRHYYAEVAQLPVELPEGQSAIQILYNFQVMVNVASPTAGNPTITINSPGIETNAEGQPVVAFTARNASRNYGYLSSGTLNIRHVSDDGRELMRRQIAAADIQQQIGFGLVGPEMSRRFVTPYVLETGQGTVEVTYAPARGR